MGAPMTGASVVMALVLVVAGLGAVTAPAAASSSSTATCERAQHDAFMTNRSIDQFDNESSVSSTVRNTKATLTDADAFVRVRLRNPNGYCVQFVVEIASGIVDPADLGNVEAANSTLESPPVAEWRAIRNLDTGETRTVVEVEVPAGSSVTYAPSKARVMSLSWTGEAKQRSSGIVDKLSGVVGYQPDLEKNEYTLERPDDRSSTTIRLTNDDGKRVDDWNAYYTTEEGVIKTVGTDSKDPVYYRQSGDTVRFEWTNESEANVTFVANPSLVDRGKQSVRAYASTTDWMSDRLDGLLGTVTVASYGGAA